MLTRRSLLAALMAVPAASAQGVASRGLHATPRSKPSGLPFGSRLTDISEAAGLRKPAICGVDKKEYIIEVVGCGVAFFDYDNDGWIDILVLSGSRLDGSAADATNRLYRNNRDGTFTEVTARAGLVRNGWASGVTVGDYNNDGYEDLFITYWGQNVLYRNNGNGTFTDVTKEAGLVNTAREWGSGCTWVDYDRDGYLIFSSPTTSLRSCNDAQGRHKRQLQLEGHCRLQPARASYDRPRLYHNNRDGTFTDVSAHSGVASATGSYGLTAVTADLDNDGWPDIYMAGDSTPSFFFHNRKDGTFREEAILRGIALSEDGMAQAGMGVALGDFNLDGNIDILKTHFSDDTPALYVNVTARVTSPRPLSGRSGHGDSLCFLGSGMVTWIITAFLTCSSSPDIYPELERTLP